MSKIETRFKSISYALCCRPSNRDPGQNYFLAQEPEISKLSVLFSVSIIFFLFISLLISSIGFLLRFPITVCHFYFSAVLTLLFTAASCLYLLRRNRFLLFSIIASCLVITFLSSLFISSHFYDLSYDGQASHQEAIIQLSNGWNPVYKQLDKLETNNLHRWLNHYSKGPWIYESMIFKLTDDIESAKLFQIWLILATFFYTLSFFLKFKNLPILLAILLSLLTSFNPVSIYQSLSFYLDGQMMSLMVMLIITLGYIYWEGHKYFYMLLFLIISTLVNTKLTAGAYTAIFLLGLILILWIKKERIKLRNTLVAALIASVIGFLIIGTNPYVTNSVYQRNPFYPVFGPDHVPMYEDMNMPGNFIGRNSLTVLFYSIFSKSDNVRFRDSKAELKIPFTIAEGELGAFTDTNAKEGGFGPLFGGAIIASFVIIWGAWIFFFQERGKTNEATLENEKHNKEGKNDSVMKYRLGFLSLATILVSCLINPVSSLARFVPQMWLFPIAAILLAFSFKTKWIRTTALVSLTALFFNNLLIGATYIGYNVEMTELYNQRLKELAILSKQDPLKIYFGHFRSGSKLRFNRFAIEFESVETKDGCRNGQEIFPDSIILQCW